MSTYRYPVKCLKCGLHFNIYSWNEAWHDEHRAFCPECGSDVGTLLLGRETLSTEIFEHVSAFTQPLESL